MIERRKLLFGKKDELLEMGFKTRSQLNSDDIIYGLAIGKGVSGGGTITFNFPEIYVEFTFTYYSDSLKKLLQGLIMLMQVE